jgi:hypothetical protein
MRDGSPSLDDDGTSCTAGEHCPTAKNHQDPPRVNSEDSKWLNFPVTTAFRATMSAALPAGRGNCTCRGNRRQLRAGTHDAVGDGGAAFLERAQTCDQVQRPKWYPTESIPIGRVWNLSRWGFWLRCSLQLLDVDGRAAASDSLVVPSLSGVGPCHSASR